MTRCFLAAIPPSDLLNPVVDLMTLGRKAFPRQRWVCPENLHVTLAFFGDVDENRYHVLEETLACCLDGIVISNFFLSGIGAFRRRGKPSVLWIQANSEGVDLLAISQIADQVAHEVGLSGRGRSYHPHLTLARCEDGTKPLRWLERRWAPPSIRGLAQVVLMNSVLTSRGPVYSESRVFSSYTKEGGR